MVQTGCRLDMKWQATIAVWTTEPLDPAQGSVISTDQKMLAVIDMALSMLDAASAAARDAAGFEYDRPQTCLGQAQSCDRPGPARTDHS
jgi:hypothetical protein